MASPNIQGWYYVKLTLKAFEDGTSTKVFNLSNRPLIDEADGATIYNPLLLGISNIGTDSGDYLPSPISGQILIDDSPNSIGYERKFSDYFERYSIVGATVQIYSANTQLDDTSITADFSLDWTTSVISYSRSDNVIQLAVSEKGLSTATVTRVIDSTSFPNAPAGSIGKYLPLVIGSSVDVKPIRINAETSTTPSYAYQTTLSTTFPSGGITSRYVKNIDGVYKAVSSASNPATAINTPTISLGSGTSIRSIKYAWYLFDRSDYPYVVTQIDVSFRGLAAAVYDGYVSIALCESTATTSGYRSPGREVATTSAINFAGYDTTLDTGADFYVTFTFSKPIVLSNETGYYLTALHTPDVGAGAVYMTNGLTATTGFKYDNGSWTASTAATNMPLFKLYALSFTDTPSSTTYLDSVTGLAAAFVDISQKGPTSVDNPSINNLDLILRTTGIKDSSGGGISGTPSLTLIEPVHIVKLLDLKYQAGAWTSSGYDLDYTKFTDTHTTAPLDRSVKGFIENRRTVSDVLAEICRNVGFRIVRYNGSSKKYALYGWGKTRSTAFVITDEDAKIISVNQLGAETVINNVTINYYRSLLKFDANANYNTNSVYSYSARGSGSTKSIALYGNAELADTGFNLLNDLDSTGIYTAQNALSMIAFFTSVYENPHNYVVLEVPLSKYKTLETMDVIEICHPSLPAYYGTSSNAELSYYGSGSSDPGQGQYMKRFQRYRAQVEGKTLNYNLGQFPTMRINCRLLINRNDPT